MKAKELEAKAVELGVKRRGERPVPRAEEVLAGADTTFRVTW